MFDHMFDTEKRRLHIRYHGFWTPTEARGAVEKFRVVLHGIGTRPFTLLDDLRDWPPQSQEVVEITIELPDIVRGAPISRNAMIIPQALLRMQVSRTLEGLTNCAVFRTFEEADAWLAEVEGTR